MAVAAPAAVKPLDTKKATSKVDVAPAGRPAPQATVKIGPAPPAAAPTPAIKPAAAVEAAPAEAAEDDSLTNLLAIAATVVALAALGIQVWMFL